MDRFDTEMFIDEVERRPAIWDIQCSDHSNKVAKNRAWQELVDIFGDGVDSLEKKTVLGLTLQKKWKNIRDAYNKEYKKGKTTPNSRKGTQYVYFARLSFLQKCVEHKEANSNTEELKNEEIQETNNEESDNLTNVTEIRPVPKKRKKPNATSESRFSNLIEKSIRSRDKLYQELQEDISNQDEDKLFCLSLYKELKKVPKNGRLATKIELLQVLQKGQTLQYPICIATQHTGANGEFWHEQQHSNTQGYFTAPLSPSAVLPSSSPLPSSNASSDSQSSIVEDIYAVTE